MGQAAPDSGVAVALGALGKAAGLVQRPHG